MLSIWIEFSICVLLILFFGSRLSRYGDIVAEKTGLSGLWVGLLLLAAITSLPELITGIGAVSFVGGEEGANLALGAVFGSNMFNLLIIALMDVIYRSGPLLSAANREQLPLATLGILLIAFAGGSILLASNVWDGAVGWVSLYSIVLVLLYIWGSRRIFRSERSREVESKLLQYRDISLRRIYIVLIISALGIIGAGTWLALIGDEIAVRTGWDTTFVGSLFLAATTSLPELAVSIAALRIGARDMAIANMLGSNMFNMGIVIAGDDLFYTSGSLFSAASLGHIFGAAIAIFMTLIIIASIMVHPRRKVLRRISWYTMALVIVYLGGAYTLFIAPWG